LQKATPEEIPGKVPPEPPRSASGAATVCTAPPKTAWVTGARHGSPEQNAGRDNIGTENGGPMPPFVLKSRTEFE